MISKVAMKGVDNDVAKYLNVFQFEVGISCGVDAILHSVNKVLSQRHEDGSLSMLTVDFLNAINMATKLYLGDEHIMSPTGVQHGDPLVPLIFALVLFPLIHKIIENCKLLIHAWYLNDETVIHLNPNIPLPHTSLIGEKYCLQNALSLLNRCIHRMTTYNDLSRAQGGGIIGNSVTPQQEKNVIDLEKDDDVVKVEDGSIVDDKVDLA
ncbi:hypothetical protein L195_g021023 [Trifolium pratense]|uniref:Reverse transcriptase domain-containing protein n=1 Tax=Trifolium pratense TaxID=57577 RepID=A0A2K3N485_TRIPR|nr:hypothetical protein L195_g021023 [Trifolium pratense]